MHIFIFYYYTGIFIMIKLINMYVKIHVPIILYLYYVIREVKLVLWIYIFFKKNIYNNNMYNNSMMHVIVLVYFGDFEDFSTFYNILFILKTVF